MLSLAQLAAAEASPEERQVIVLCGVTGDGKSSTGNTLTGSPSSFAVSGGLSSATREAAHADYLFGDVANRVVDTIGFSDTSLSAEETLERFRAFADHAPCGIDVFCFVVRWGRFKPEHEAALDSFERNVGAEALPHVLLCFTHCGLATEALTAALEAEAPPALQAWLARIGGVAAVDNVNSGGDDTARARLHEAFERVRARGGARYSNAALEEARARHRAASESEAAAFAAAVSDWRKGGSGPIVVEREMGGGGSGEGDGGGGGGGGGGTP